MSHMIILTVGEVNRCDIGVFSEKDVNRTDRNNRFYEGIDNPGLALLHDILMTYCMYDFDLGEAHSSSCSTAVFRDGTMHHEKVKN